jgi:ABC-type sugar transport system ATPase subunit
MIGFNNQILHYLCFDLRKVGGVNNVDTSEYVLEALGISKIFPGVKALDNINLRIKRGEVHALMGENGAGKSTLMKIIMGQYKPDQGEILFNGEKVVVDSPAKALNLGISMIHQELNPIPDMTIIDNLFMGREILHDRLPFINMKKMAQQTVAILKKFHLDLNPKLTMSKLSLAQIQMIEIIKAVTHNSRLIIMDEPTSSLSDKEVTQLFTIIRELKSNGVSIIYISHRLEEIFELVDSVTVLRDGQFIGTEEIKSLSKDKLISMMVGRELANIFCKEKVTIGDTVLEVRNLTRKPAFYDINFKIRRGEIIGIAGLVGAGRSEIVRSIFGIDAIDSGEIFLEGQRIKINSPRDAIKNKIAMVSEDRKELGLVLSSSIKENIALPNLNSLSTGPFINLAQEKVQCQRVSSELKIKTRSLKNRVENLSGGNQQKVVIAKWLLTKPKVMILDEPTRGIDVGAKTEIHSIMNALVKEGMAVILISSELPEIIGMSDRIIVIAGGRVRGEFLRDEMDNQEMMQENILKCALMGE